MSTYWNKTIWQGAIAALPPGLTAPVIAAQFGKEPCVTAFWLRHFGYVSPDRRKLWRKENGWVSPRKKLMPEQVDWKNETNNEAIATRFGVCRERVRQVRKEQCK